MDHGEKPAMVGRVEAARMFGVSKIPVASVGN